MHSNNLIIARGRIPDDYLIMLKSPFPDSKGSFVEPKTVYVFPDDVCPYVKMVLLIPLSKSLGKSLHIILKSYSYYVSSGNTWSNVYSRSSYKFLVIYIVFPFLSTLVQ